MFLHSRLQKKQGAGWGPGIGVERVPGTYEAPDAFFYTITTKTNPGTGVVDTCNPSTAHAEGGLL